jgi:glutamine amidotransferase
MCRLILARGDFRTNDIVDAALAMSTGVTADHEGPIRVHPNGWGAVWREPAVEGGLGIHRDVRSMADSVHESPVRSVRSDFLTIHTRHATLQRNAGLQFTHPLERIEDGFTWYFMHNGFLPTVYQRLGLPRSEFDSAEYFQYIVPRGSMTIGEDETRLRLRAITPGGTSGNSVAVNRECAYVIHWTSEPNRFPRFFGMHRLARPDLLVVSSEIIPSLAAPAEWEPLKPEQILDISLNAAWN